MKDLAKGGMITAAFYIAVIVLAYFVIKHIILINKTIKATE